MFNDLISQQHVVLQVEIVRYNRMLVFSELICNLIVPCRVHASTSNHHFYPIQVRELCHVALSKGNIYPHPCTVSLGCYQWTFPLGTEALEPTPWTHTSCVSFSAGRIQNGRGFYAWSLGSVILLDGTAMLAWAVGRFALGVR